MNVLFINQRPKAELPEDRTMRKSQSNVFLKNAALTIVFAGVIGMTDAAQATQKGEQRFQTEVANCLLEVKNQLNVVDATRIRHNITDYKQAELGTAVTIQTSVFTPDSQHDYEIYCQINGDHTPFKFRMKEV
jgi:hypothetical protein